jgi:hypothetical protein
VSLLASLDRLLRWHSPVPLEDRVGLVLEHFREYDYCNGYRPYKQMKELDGGRWTVPDGKPDVPLMYTVAARKPA